MSDMRTVTIIIIVIIIIIDAMFAYCLSAC